MNNIRIPIYKILAICFLVGLSIIYLNFYGTHTELVDSYSLGRYRIVFDGMLEDSTYKTRLEFSKISHKVVFPYFLFYNSTVGLPSSLASIMTSLHI